MSLKDFTTKQTPQSEPMLGKDMVENSAGGYVFEVDKWQRLKRFLILGTDGGTYYIKDRDLTKENVDSVLACIREDGKLTVDMAIDVSVAGRAPKNDPAIFVLALAITHGDVETRRYVANNTPKVCRTGTHIMQFVGFVKNMGGFGETKKRALNNWLFAGTPDNLAYQMVKYRMREGWTHHDLHHIAHPRGDDHPGFNDLFRWAKNGKFHSGLPRIIDGFDRVQVAKSASDVVKLIAEYRLPHEAIPTEFKNDPKVQSALIQHMPATAMLRNLGNFSKSGLLTAMSDTEKFIVERLSSAEYLQRGRIHPIAVLLALKTYASGEGFRGSGTWTPTHKIIDALNDAFYGTFGNVEPIGNNVMLCLDVSGSMSRLIANTNVSAAEASCALAMIHAQTEPNYVLAAFAGPRNGSLGFRGRQISLLPWSTKMRLDDMVAKTQALTFGGTDCALPMLAARDNNMPIDTFLIFTDSETWAGNVHPKQALDEYRQKSGRDAKCVVVGMTSNGFSIADPTDTGMLDVVGFDTTVPNVIAEFAS